MDNHHSSSYHFLLNLHQVLSYLGKDPDAGFKKKKNFKEKNMYTQNRDYVRSLQDAGSIPYDNTNINNFIDVVDGHHDVFTPNIFDTKDDG